MMEVEYSDVAEAIDRSGLEYKMVRPDYSGRAMYGATCLGFVYDELGDVIQFSYELAQILEDDTWYQNSRQDSMGLSSIVYWPYIQVVNIPEREEEDDPDY
jgi:hypothetical protein